MAKSQLPDYYGTYKGMVLDSALGKTKKAGLPQLIQRFLLTEYYDQKEGEWYDVSENNWVITAYFCLYGRKDGQEDEYEESMNHAQIIKVYGWDGCGFEFLYNTENFNGKTVQIRTAENEYNGKTTMQVSWIDVEDAEPMGNLRSVDANEVAELEAMFGGIGKKAAAPKKAASAKKAPPKAPKKAAAPKEAPEKPADDEPEQEAPVESAEDRKAKLAAKYRKQKAADKKAADKKTKEAEKKAAPPEEPAGEVTEPPFDADAVPEDYAKLNAWNDIYELADDEVEDENVNKAWKAAITEISESGKEADLDNVGWAKVRQHVLENLS